MNFAEREIVRSGKKKKLKCFKNSKNIELSNMEIFGNKLAF